MTTKINVRKLELTSGSFKVYANYSGSAVQSVELEYYEATLETTYFLETKEDVFGVMNALPLDVLECLKKLLK